MYITQIGNINFNVNVNATLLYLFFLYKGPKTYEPAFKRLYKRIEIYYKAIPVNKNNLPGIQNNILSIQTKFLFANFYEMPINLNSLFFPPISHSNAQSFQPLWPYHLLQSIPALNEYPAYL